MIRQRVPLCTYIPYGRKYASQHVKQIKSYPIKRPRKEKKIPVRNFYLKKYLFNKNVKVIEQYYNDFLRNTL